MNRLERVRCGEYYKIEVLYWNRGDSRGTFSVPRSARVASTPPRQTWNAQLASRQRGRFDSFCSRERQSARYLQSGPRQVRIALLALRDDNRSRGVRYANATVRATCLARLRLMGLRGEAGARKKICAGRARSAALGFPVSVRPWKSRR